MQNDAVIVSAVRLPSGKMNGSLSAFPVHELGGRVICEALRRTPLSSEMIDEVIFGNITSTEPRGNPAREAALKAGIPYEKTAFTVNKNCGSGLKAIELAALMIKGGERRAVIAGGMENMSRIPYVLKKVRAGYRMGHTQMTDLLIDLLEGMGVTAENVANRYGITRQQQDQFALRSQALASLAWEQGYFDGQVAPISAHNGKNHFEFCMDEGLRPDVSLAMLAKLPPAFLPEGSVTAGNSSSINDGAAALVLMDSEVVRQQEIRPLARVVSWAEAGIDPSFMGLGPVPAIQMALAKAKMNLGDIDLIELNEAFAAQALGVIHELNLNIDKINVNGGAIALGHPVGATGAVLMVKLIHELIRRDVNTGMVSLCIGGGQGIAMVVERV